MQKAIIYCRVSSIKQSTEGHGLESQEHRCREYAGRKGYDVVKVFKDSFTGEGDFMNRPAMSSLLGFLDRTPETNYIVIFDDLKRFARDTVFHLKLRREFDARKAKVECLNFTFEDTPEGNFIETILAAQGELERKQNKRQVIQKMKARLDAGYWPFVAPYGYEMIKNALHGKVLSKVDSEAAIVQEALEGFSTGRFENQVAVQKFLMLKKFKKDNYVSLDSVKRILTNSLYAGYVEHKPWKVGRRIGHHEPIISLQTFQQIENRLNKKSIVVHRKDTSLDFPLRGFVLCSECQHKITASWSTGRNGKHPYYHCSTNTCPVKGKTIKRETLEYEFEVILRSIKPKERTLNLTKEILLDLWNKKIGEVETIGRDFEKSLDEIRSKMRLFLDRIGKTTNEAMIRTYENEIEKLGSEEKIIENQLLLLQTRRPEFRTALEQTFEFLKNPYVYWKKDDLASKHLVLKLVFSDNLTYKRGEGFRTAHLALPLRVFELSALDNSSIVDIVSKSWNQLETWVFDTNTLICSVEFQR